MKTYQIKSLNKKDFSLLDYALAILSSDYDPENKHTGTQEPYRVKMQKEIEKLSKKLDEIQRQAKRLKKTPHIKR